MRAINPQQHKIKDTGRFEFTERIGKEKKYISVFFTLQDSGIDLDGNYSYFWNVGIYAGTNKRIGNKWYYGYHQESRGNNTNNAGIEGLLYCLYCVLKFTASLPDNHYIGVGFEDNQRKEVYSRLGKYGFEFTNVYMNFEMNFEGDEYRYCAGRHSLNQNAYDFIEKYELKLKGVKR